MSGSGEREGQQLGNYRLTHLLGRGNFADVYLGQHIHLNTQAAIKVLHGRLTGNDLANFINEARLIAHLRHPHIVQVLDFGVEDTTPFLVMDYAPNGNLRQRHPKGTRLALDTVLTTCGKSPMLYFKIPSFNANFSRCFTHPLSVTLVLY